MIKALFNGWVSQFATEENAIENGAEVLPEGQQFYASLDDAGNVIWVMGESIPEGASPYEHEDFGEGKVPDGQGGWVEPESNEPQAIPVTINLNDDRIVENEQINVTVQFAVDSVSGQLDAPIVDDAGKLVKLKRMNVVDGLATIQLAFAQSGYYWIRQARINQSLAEFNMPFRVAFDDVRIVVAEE